jgi:uncharacterized protein (DUF111 family)
MKKGRPGIVLTALGRPLDEAALSELIFRETTTLGLRRQLVERRSLPREIRTVATKYGAVRVKLAYVDGQIVRAMPEYDDCRRLAEQTGAPLRDILAEAERAGRDTA